VLSGLYLWGKL